MTPSSSRRGCPATESSTGTTTDRISWHDGGARAPALAPLGVLELEAVAARHAAPRAPVASEAVNG